jgi:hypothetical protein
VGQPREGFEAKLSRADKHLRALDKSIDRFLEANPYRTVLEPQVNGTEYVVRAHIEKPLKVIKWGLLMGDCLANFRSALDHLAWELAGPNPPNKTEFPIFHKPKDFKSRGKGGGLYKIRGIKDRKARTIIKDAQPCSGSNPKSSALWALQELNNRDKHRFLNLGASVVNGFSYWEGPGAESFIEGVIEGPFESGAEICRFELPPGATEPQVDVDFTFAFGVALTESGPGEGWPLTGVLRRIQGTIRADVANPIRQLI